MRERSSLVVHAFPSYQLSFLLALFLLLPGMSSTLARAQGSSSRTGAFVYTGNTPWGSPSNALVNGYVINGTSGTLTKVERFYIHVGQIVVLAVTPAVGEGP